MGEDRDKSTEKRQRRNRLVELGVLAAAADLRVRQGKSLPVSGKHKQATSRQEPRVRYAIAIAGLLIGLGIAAAGMFGRYEVVPTTADYGRVVWRIDRLTGEVTVCHPEGSGPDVHVRCY